MRKTIKNKKISNEILIIKKINCKMKIITTTNYE